MARAQLRCSFVAQFPGQLGVMQAAGIAQGACAVRAAAPLGGLGTAAAMASSGRSGFLSMSIVSI